MGVVGRIKDSLVELSCVLYRYGVWHLWGNIAGLSIEGSLV